MILFCCLCMHSYHGQMGEEQEAMTVINGQAVCSNHSGYVQGALFSQALARVLEDEKRS